MKLVKKKQYLSETTLITYKIPHISISRYRDHLQSKSEMLKLQQNDKSLCYYHGNLIKF